jgi:hypothetical protein
MIAQYYALGVQCSVCTKQSSPINIDRTKYLQPGQEAYTKMVSNRAEERGIQEGFIRVGKKSPSGTALDRHLCGDCVVSFSNQITKTKKSSSTKKTAK